MPLLESEGLSQKQGGRRCFRHRSRHRSPGRFTSTRLAVQRAAFGEACAQIRHICGQALRWEPSPPTLDRSSAPPARCWSGQRTTDAQHGAVNRVFANIGKPFAAYGLMIAYGEGRFDQHFKAELAGDPAGRYIRYRQ